MNLPDWLVGGGEGKVCPPPPKLNMLCFFGAGEDSCWSPEVSVLLVAPPLAQNWNGVAAPTRFFGAVEPNVNGLVAAGAAKAEGGPPPPFPAAGAGAGNAKLASRSFVPPETPPKQ